MQKSKKPINVKKERLESIRRAHLKKSYEFTKRMEDYLEVISELIVLKGYATPTAISNYMNVRPPSATKMLQKLGEQGYIEYAKYKGLKLTSKGKNLANNVRQKHLVLVNFFELIGVCNSIANEDAEEIEHYLNSKTISQLRKFTTYIKSNPKILVTFRKTSSQ